MNHWGHLRNISTIFKFQIFDKRNSFNELYLKIHFVSAYIADDIY